MDDLISRLEQMMGPYGIELSTSMLVCLLGRVSARGRKSLACLRAFEFSFVLFFACVAVLPLAAEDVESRNGFDSSLSLGFSLTDGNSETTQANLSLLTEGERAELGSVRAGLDAGYGESEVNDEKETTVDNLRIFAGARKTLSERTFASLNGEYMYDNVAEVDYRATVSPGFGGYLIKNDRTSLSIEAGPAYIWEEVSGIADDYLAVRFAERLDVRLSETAKLWQSLEYIPATEDFGEYLFNAEIGAEAAVNSRVSLRIVLQDNYDSDPGADNEKNDIALIAGLSVSL